ncbi:MAG: hypothetical protein ACE5WD_02005 [Candidatus Aminicenantia bacterium]
MKNKSILLIGIITIFMVSFEGISGNKINSFRRKHVPLKSAYTWTDPVNISNSAIHSWGPVVAANSEGKAYVVWVEESQAKRIYFSTNEDGTWEKAVKVSGNLKIDEGPVPSLFVDKKGIAHIAFAARVSTYEIFYNYYQNGKLKNNLNVSDTRNGGSVYQSIVVDNANQFIYLVWQDDQNAPSGAAAYWEIMLSYKDPDKTHWSYIDIIPTVTNRAYTPEITIDGKGAAHVAWINRSQANNSIVWYSYNPEPTDETKWSNPVAVSEGTGIDFCFPKIDSDNNGNVYIVWENKSKGNKEIFFRQKINGEWKEITNFSDTSTPSEQPTIAVDKETGDIYVAWAENIGNWEIFLKSYEDGQWSEAINLSNNSSISGNPSLWVDEQGGVHLVYADNFKGPYEVMYRYRAGKRRLLPPVNLGLETKINRILFHDEKINTLRWEKNPENEQNPSITIIKYSVYRKEVGQDDEAYQEIYTTPDANTFEYQDRNLSLNKKYAYTVTAWDQNGNESEKPEPVSEE